MAGIGVFGGSFNPPHLGHVQAVRAARELLGLDQVLVIPAAAPPHKAMPEGSPDPQTRLELTRLAMADLPWVQVLDLELRRAGKSYTSDTLRALAERYPGQPLYLIMGTDMFLSLHTWHEPEVICQLASPTCLHRTLSDGSDALTAQAEKLAALYGCRPVLLDNPVLELSSTTTRRLLALRAGEACLSPAVWQAIFRRGLYGQSEDLTGLSYPALEAQALKRYAEARVPHALGVVQAARELALRWGESREDAARAAILHDVTKALKGPEQLQLSRAYGIVNAPFDEAHPSLLHAVTGAGAARVVFGEPEHICQAIRWHTTGKPGMTTLEKIIYLADYIEPNRSFPGLENVRQASETDLDLALELAMEGSLRDLARRGIEASELTARALDALRAERNGI